MSALPAVAADADEKAPVTVLCVDVEANILNALRRLFRPQGYRVLVAESGTEGLTLLQQEPVDLVISDMRMPNMSGAEFLAEVRSRWPDTVRILLTGHADVASTIAAINNGEIYRYVTKPWDDNDIALIVRQALERKDLEREKTRLEALTLRQNEELRDLNANLEEKVRERTEKLQGTTHDLALANEKLKNGFVTSIKVFSNLIELRHETLAGHSRRVADLARRLAIKLGMDKAAVQDVMLAGLLHDIGKIGLSDTLLAKSPSQMNGDELALLRKHPTKGESALLALDELRGTAKLIRAHHERFDGLGYPDGMQGIAIPLGARVLALANDYDALQIGTLVNQRMSVENAQAFIQESRAKRYDPTVVDAFLQLTGGAAPEAAPVAARGMVVYVADLKPGMVLTRDLFSREGVLLLAADYLLDDRLIRQIQGLEAAEGGQMKVYVRSDH